MDLVLIVLIMGLINLVRNFAPCLKSNSWYRKIFLMICGITLGSALEMLTEKFIYHFVFGMGNLIHKGIYYAISDYYTNHALLGISISISIILGFWVGKKLNQYQITVIRVIPFLFFLSFVFADICTPSVIKSDSLICGTTRFAMINEVFSLLSIIDFIFLMIFSSVSLHYHKKLACK